MYKGTKTHIMTRWLRDERRQIVGYLLAVLLQGMLIGIVYLMLHQLPSFRFAGLLSLLLVALVALFWGTGPSLLSTCIGALLLGLLLLPSIFSWSVDPADLLGTVLFLLVGCIVSIAAGQTQRARRAAEELTTQLTIRRQLEQCLRDSEREVERSKRASLQAANQHMSDFLSLVSHELRTPLTSIKSNIWLSRNLLNDYDEQGLQQKETLHDIVKEVQESLSHVDHQVDVQKRLVDDLLDVSRMQANQLELRLFPYDLSSIVRQVVADLRLVDSTHRLSIVNSDKEEVLVLVDADRICQVLNNYITNAFKYALPESPIEISLQVREQQAMVAVRDTGPGLSQEEQQHVWERFYQVRKPAGASHRGELGLGLYICKTIIERHQGQVGVESVPGEGSTFWFALPLTHVLVEDV